MPKTVKIFISSTFRDMNAERDVLIKNVFPRLREKAEGIGLFIREVDLRWGVTEDEAKRGEALEICLDGIEECRPYFLCMLGKRYGWIPAPNFIRVDDFNEITSGGKISTEEIQLVKSSYYRASKKERVYTLDYSLPNEIKDRLQQILENAGLQEAMESITEKEINHAVLNKDIPRSIPELEVLLKSLPPEKQLTAYENKLLRKNYVRTEGVAIWRLMPGLNDIEQDQLKQILEKIGYKINVHSFFYFRKDVNEDNPDFAETDQKTIGRLNNLKRTIMTSEEPELKPESDEDFYHCTWHPDNIGTDREPIQELQEFEERIFNDLWSHIQENKEVHIDEDKDKSDQEKEMDFHHRFIDSRTYNFYGRTELLDELEKKINLALNGQLFLDKKDFEGNPVRTQHIMIVGEPGSGKSALLAKLYQELISHQNIETRRLVIPFFVGASPRSSNPRYIMKNLNQIMIDEFEIKEVAKDKAGNVKSERSPKIPTDINILTETFLTFLKLVQQPEKEIIIGEEKHDNEKCQIALTAQETVKKNIVIFLDAINQLQIEENAREMNWLPDDLPEKVCIVTSLVEDTRKATEEFDIEASTTALEAMHKRHPKPIEINVSKLSKDEQEEIINNYLDLFNKKLPDGLLQMLIRKQDADNPLYLTVVLEELRIFSKHEELQDFIDNKIPGNVIDMFDSVLVRVEKAIFERFIELGDRNLFSEFMKYIACANNGINEEDLRLLMGEWRKLATEGQMESRYDNQDIQQTGGMPKHEIQLSDFHWGELKRSMKSYLFTSGEDWNFFHQQLKQAVGNRYLRDPKNRYDTHKTISDYLEHMGYGHLSTVRNLPHHLVKAGELRSGVLDGVSEEWQRVEEILTNIDFIEAKIKEGMVYELIGDYAFALRALPEAKTEVEQEKRHQEKVWKYVRDLIAYSSDPEGCKLPVPPVSSKPRQDAEKGALGRNDRSYAQVETLKAWGHFVKNHALLLEQDYSSTFQHAYNSASTGPVHDRMQDLLDAGSDPSVSWFMLQNRPQYEPHPTYLNRLPVVADAWLSPDGLQAFSLEGYRVWDVETGKCLKVFEGPKGSPRAMCVTPDGQRMLLSNLRDSTVCVWNLETEECLQVLEGHTGKINAVCTTPDGRHAVSGSEDSSVRAWDLETGECLKILEGHSGSVEAVCVTANGRCALSGSIGKTVHVWDVETGECLKILEGHRGVVKTVSVTPDGQYAVSGSDDSNIRVWDVETGECLKILEGHRGSVEAVCVTPDGLRAVSGGYDMTVRVWDLVAGRCISVINIHREVCSLDITPDGTKALAADSVLDLRNASCAGKDSEYRGAADVGVTPGGKKAVVSTGGYLQAWDLESGKCTNSFEVETRVAHISLSPDRKTVVFGRENNRGLFYKETDNMLRVWDLGMQKCSQMLEGHTGPVEAVDITPDGRYAVSGGGIDDNTLHIWDLLNGRCINVLTESHDNCVNGVVIAPNGKEAVVSHGRGRYQWTTTTDDMIVVWNLETGKRIKALGEHVGVSAVAIGPDGKRLVSIGSKKLYIWDLENAILEKQIQTPEDQTSMTITHDGRYVVSGGGNLLCVWDLRTGELHAKLMFRSQEGSITSIATDGPRIVATNSSRICIFTLANTQFGSAIVVPTRLYSLDKRAWDDHLTATCPWCGHRSTVTKQKPSRMRHCVCGKQMHIIPMLCDGSKYQLKEENRLEKKEREGRRKSEIQLAENRGRVVIRRKDFFPLRNPIVKIIQGPAQVDQSFKIATRTTVGRGGECDLQFNDSKISRHHATFLYENDECVIVDENSTNGIFINQIQIRKCLLRDGDIIDIGNFKLQFNYENYESRKPVKIKSLFSE